VQYVWKKIKYSKRLLRSAFLWNAKYYSKIDFCVHPVWTSLVDLLLFSMCRFLLVLFALQLESTAAFLQRFGIYVFAFCMQTQTFEKSWEHAKDFYSCCVGLEKVNDRIPREKLCWVLREYDVNGRLLMTLKPLYSCSKVYVRFDGAKSQPFIYVTELNHNRSYKSICPCRRS